MSGLPNWTRRQFLAGSAAAATLLRQNMAELAAQARSKGLESAGTSPEEVSGSIRPLLDDNTARPLRYTPDDGSFLIRNGKQFFNRPLYGPNNPFRVDAGDLPEFSLYLPGHGGNLRLGILAPGASRWLFAAAEVVARYRPGRMLYEIRDPLLGSGSLHMELLTHPTGAGILLRVEQHDMPPDVKLMWAFGGVSGRKGRRDGDIGCEVEPVNQFFQVRPEECAGNRYQVNGSTARLHSRAADLLLQFPHGAALRVADARAWTQSPADLLRSSGSDLPVLVGTLPLAHSSPLFFSIQRLTPAGQPLQDNLSDTFAARSHQVAAIANTLRAATPDPFINAAVPALAIAADALWDARQGCVMHGAVAWRRPLVGWRGPYVLDVLGDHERMRQNIRHWIARQNTDPVTTPSPATGPADPGTHLTRKESLLHSSGDLSHNHYDMNLVFFDGFLRHLRWTGDLDFAREIWPAFVRHLAWERRLFRRVFTTDAGEQLPLYEGYACIWASDNLQYNGGGTAHASAYNYFSHRQAAELARLLGEDPDPYKHEASLILEGMRQLLWLPHQGTFGESKDILTDQTVYTSPALWSMYHSMDSEVPDPVQAWQMASERLHALRAVPIHGPGVPEGDWFLLSCSDWLPYEWSLNLLALAENMHMALALWQAGMSEEAFRLFKGNLLDSMFQGLCPGNFHMSSQLDVHRQESQRDFGDPIGIASRALVEGLFGITPDMLRGRLILRPGFPVEWNHASLNHPDLSIAWHREQHAEETREHFNIESRLKRPATLLLILPARSINLPRVRWNRKTVSCSFVPNAAGRPCLRVELPAASHWGIEVSWHGKAPTSIPAHGIYELGEPLALPAGASMADVDDPQHCLHNGHVALSGHHTVFVRMREGDCHWSLPISFDGKPSAPVFAAVTALAGSLRAEPLDLQSCLRENITKIFRRAYVSPRSPYCSLSIPEQGIGGWANFDPQPVIDDSGLRAAGGLLQTPLDIPFRTPAAGQPNCAFLSQWQQDQSRLHIPLTGRAQSIYLLMAGTTLPQASHMVHGRVMVHYADGTASTLMLRNPETWWPIERDYLLDDYLFRDDSPLPPRVDLRTGKVRMLTRDSFLGKGRPVLGGAATILQLALNPAKPLASLEIEATLYGIVLGLLGATLARSG